jgi:hypothetical protein
LSHPPRIVGGVAPRGEFDLSALSAAHNSCRDILSETSYLDRLAALRVLRTPW